MNNLSNFFSTLRVDAEDDKEQMASLSVAKGEKRAKNSGLFFAIHEQNLVILSLEKSVLE